MPGIECCVTLGDLTLFPTYRRDIKNIRSVRSQLGPSSPALLDEGTLSICMLNSEYIVGLVDGEGSFTVYVRDPMSSKERKRRARVEPKFYLKLIEKDKVVLDELRKFFKCGNIYFQKDNRPNHQHCYRYEVTSRSDLAEIIIPFFQKHPLRLPSKQRDFKLFCKIYSLILQGQHLSAGGLSRIYALKQHMH